MSFESGVPNIRVVIREATDENLTVDVPNVSVKIDPGSQYNVNIIPNTVKTLRTGSFNTYSDFAGFANTSSYALVAQTLIGSIQSASYAYTASNILGGTQNYIPLWSTNSTLSSSLLYQTGSSVLLGSTTQHTPEAPDRFGVFAGVTDSYNLISAHGEIDDYLQVNLKNFSSGVSASTDLVATADTGTEDGGYINIGINSSGYNIPNAIGNALDAYIYATGSNLLIGNASPDKSIILFTGGEDAIASARINIDPNGSVGINSSTFDPIAPEALLVQSVNDSTYNLIKAYANPNSYVQFNIQHTGTGDSASADVVATADNGNESINYIDMGINGSQYGIQGLIGGVNDAYLYSTGNHLHIGNASPGQELMFFVGGSDVDVTNKLTLRDTNRHELTGSIEITQGITGSLFGTASWALNALSASYVSGSSTVGPGTSQSIALFNSLNTISSSVLFQSGSRIGIGTVNPARDVEVIATTTSSLRLSTTNAPTTYYTDLISYWNANKAFEIIQGGTSILRSYLQGYSGLEFGTTTNNIRVSESGNFVSILSNGLERIKISGSGNVGIGTTNPSSSLHISSNATVVTIEDNNSGQPTSIAYVQYKYNAGNLGYVGYNGIATGSLDVWNEYIGNIRFGTNNIERMRISSSGDVGIGTTAPGVKLDVQGTSIDSRIYSTNAGGKARLFIRGDTANMSYESDGTAQTSLLFDNTAGHIAYQYGLGASGFWRFFTSGSERVRINSTGNVGIGTTVPGTTLHVQGAISASSYTSSISNAVGFLGTASWAQTSSIAVAANSITFTTFSNASYYFPQNVRVDGTLTVEKLQTEYVTSSIIYESGSTKFGDSLDDTHVFTGSMSVTGSLNVNNVLMTAGSNPTVNTGTRVVGSFSTASYDAAHFDYVIKKGTSLRTGIVMTTWVAGTATVEHTDVSTVDIGNTSDVILSTDVSAGSVRLLATTISDNWIIKAAARLF